MRQFIFCILFTTVFIGDLYSQSGIEIAKKVLPFTVSIEVMDQFKKPLALGSGFIVGSGKVITNVHVVEGSHYGEITEDDTGVKHKIVGYLAIDKSNDLVLLSVPSLKKEGLTIVDTTTEVGQTIYALGNPLGLSGTISEGLVSGIRKVNNSELLQVSAPISPGSSGGPIVNTSGDVIAVSVASLTSGQNLNFGVPGKYVKSLLNIPVTEIKNLNTILPEPKVKNSKVSSSGVFVSNIVWDNVNGYPQYFDQALQHLSITNDTENKIGNIRMVVLVYKNNVPIDYFEITLFPLYSTNNDDIGNGPIEPFLGKTLTLEEHTDWNARFKSEYQFVLNKNLDETVVFRILDYSILEE